MLKPNNNQARPYKVVPLTEAAVAMVEANMGITVMAKWALKPFLSKTTLTTLPIGPKGLFRKHYAAYLADRIIHDYDHYFLKFLKSEIHLR